MNATSRRVRLAAGLLMLAGWAVCVATEPDLTLAVTAVGGLTLAVRWHRAGGSR